MYIMIVSSWRFIDGQMNFIKCIIFVCPSVVSGCVDDCGRHHHRPPTANNRSDHDHGGRRWSPAGPPLPRRSQGRVGCPNSIISSASACRLLTMAAPVMQQTLLILPTVCLRNC